MIYCVLDGDRVYPSLSSNIKITRENPELKDKGSYTLDVTFPMSIYENQVKFRHLNRIDVSMQKNDYDSATLYVDQVPVISGIGVITSVNNKEVKLQIMNANSEFKYVSGFDKRYIDDMFKWWNNPGILGGKVLPGNPPIIMPTNFFELFMPTMINYSEATKSQQHVGDASIGIYTPVYDETNDRIVNEIAMGIQGGPLLMINPECQFNLLYIMQQALSYMGYRADLSAIDVFPWNRIYIVNTGCILPHWTLERFITEFKAFFRLSLRFEGNKAVFGRSNYDAEAVSYECLDEFTSEFDDEGIQSNSTSNLRYNLYDPSEKTFYIEIPDEIMEAFTLREYDSESAMYNAFAALNDTEKAQSIFSTPTGYFYARTDNVTETGAQYTLNRFGHFNKLVRDKENDDAEELGIVPVNMLRKEIKFRTAGVGTDGGLIPNGEIITDAEEPVTVIIPVAESEDAPNNQFYTVQQAIEDGESVDMSSRSESERMEVFFLGSGTKSFTALKKTVTMATIGTDHTIDSDFKDKVSFALSKVPDGTVYVGQFHTGTSRINGKNQRCIKFLCNDIPDPTRIFIFHNKRYVCEKIEIQITEKGIDQVKTGYFYEIIS